MISIHPLSTKGEIYPGADLAGELRKALLAEALTSDRTDVLAVTQKIVSKAENRFVDLATVAPGPEALRLAELTRKDPRLVELVLSESAAVVRASPNVLITRHRQGYVMANAGIDHSSNGGADQDIAARADTTLSRQLRRANNRESAGRPNLQSQIRQFDTNKERARSR